MSPAAAEAVVLTTLHAELEKPTVTDAKLDRMASYWAGLQGHVADEARHLIDEAFEYRQAFRRAMDKGVLL